MSVARSGWLLLLVSCVYERVDVIVTTPHAGLARWAAATFSVLTPTGDPNAVGDYTTGVCGGLPCDRGWFALEYDARARRSLAIGGSGDTCGLSDVWAYDLAANAWSQLVPDEAPSWPGNGLVEHALTFDPVHDRMWIQGGGCSGGFGYYDSIANAFTEVPRPVAAAAVNQPGFAFADGQVFVVSGSPSWQPDPGERTSVFDTTTASWADAAPSVIPPPRQEIAEVMVYDKAHRKLVLFGGMNALVTPETHLGDTWEYDVDTNTWSETTPDPSPPPRYQHVMVYDSNHAVVVMNGGDGCDGICSDTWVYNTGAHQWSELPDAGGPGRRLHGAAYDVAEDALVIWGGKSPEGGNAPREDVFVLR
jgi:hypothetical protein